MGLQKLTNVISTTITIANGDKEGDKVITHGLTDQYGDDLTPDEVDVELVSSTGTNPNNVIGHRITRSTPEDGTVTVQLSAGAANASGDDWVYTVRLIPKFYHSIQSNDHAV
jgi:hypothetical protein